MSWLVKIVLTFFSVFTFLFLVIYQNSDFKNNQDSMDETDRNSDVDQFSRLIRSNVKISEPEKVSKKLRKMAEDGPDTIHIIFDFDKTLSKPTKSRKPVFSSLEIFDMMGEVPQWFKSEMNLIWSELDSKLEDPNLTKEDKIAATEYTVDEYAKRVQKLQMENMPQLIVRDATKSFTLRDNTDKTFSILKNSSVSTTILSGGLADVIIAVLRDNGIDVNHIRIIANYLKYTDGKLDGFTDTFIHIFNKNELAMKNAGQSKELEKRQNIILVGDNLADANMADGAPPTANKLTIGFLNTNDLKYMDLFLRTYDIVIIEDLTMNVVNDLLEEILKL